MILEIVNYGHPALRSKGRRIEKPDDKTRQLAQNMLDTVYNADGVGLAAQQIGMPIQLCVIDITEVTEIPSTLRVDGKPVSIKEHMPMVLLNPQVEIIPSAPEVGGEGCLSFPGIYLDVARQLKVRVHAMRLDGTEWNFEAEGYLARVIQHETDHLNGILFIDRINAAQREEIHAKLERLHRTTLARLH